MNVDLAMDGRAGRLAAWTMRRLIQLAWIFGAVLCALALAAWFGFDPGDPSWNKAAETDVANPLGPPGAIVADLLRQAFGLAGPFLAAAGGVWCVRGAVSSRRVGATRLEIACAIAALILGCGSLAAAPALGDWPYAVGRGGLLGDGAKGLAGFLWSRLAPETAPSWSVDAALALSALAAAGLYGVAVRGWGPIAGGVVWVLRMLRRVVNGSGADPRKTTSAPPARKSEKPVKTAPKHKRPKPEQPPAPIPAPAKTAKPTVARTVDPPTAGRQTRLGLEDDARSYDAPPLDLLSAPPPKTADDADDASLQENARLLETVLKDFGVNGEVTAVRPGPVVTLYEFEPAAGVKSARVIGLADDVARNMSAIAARIAVVPGRTTLGIELPNPRRETVALRELFEADIVDAAKAKLPLALGKGIGGEPIVADLAAMPHLLVAGTTGAGKSVAVNSMILSLVQHRAPEECRLVLIDPKMLELSVYDGMPHLLAPVVTDPKKAVAALRWTVREMESRYQAMSKLGVRNIDGFNERAREARAVGEPLTRRVQTGYDKDTGEPVFEEETIESEPLPYLVVFIDEMADLMLVAGKDIEAAVQRLAQMARAAGIHLVMATQRPSVDVITGTIKANFPTRISFQVTSKIDSRTILGEQGAEQLLGKGDMLFMQGGGRVKRVHGPFVSDEEVEKVVAHLKKSGPPSYVEAVTQAEEDAVGSALEPFAESGEDADGENALYDQAVAVVARDKRASTSYVQRRLKIGYNRAATLIERMEREGVVSAPNHAGKREVLVGEPGEGVRE